MEISLIIVFHNSSKNLRIKEFSLRKILLSIRKRLLQNGSITLCFYIKIEYIDLESSLTYNKIYQAE